ncbi:galactosylceramide sulfotransferase-like [Glandiceps talaboti]
MKIMRGFVVVNLAALCCVVIFFILTWKEYDGTKDYLIRTNRKSLQQHNVMYIQPTSAIYSENRENSCYPWRKIVFIKTHKTASTTTNTIIQRYGYLQNLTFVLPRQSHIFSETQLFSRQQVFHFERWTYGKEARPDFDIMAGHFRYNRPEIDKIIPRAMHVTILRNPVDKFESTFGYYEMAKRLNIQRAPNPLETFMRRPMYYMTRPHFHFRMKLQLRNGLMFSLGYPLHNAESDALIQYKIDELDHQLDLVMLTEYYDESLILLKELLCWGFDDILYIPKGFRSEKLRNSISPEVAKEIRAWNKADVKLYDHFNKTFWRKVEEYGPNFQEDLAHFRRRQEEFVDECIDPDRVKTVMGKEDALVLRPNASELCRVSYYRVFTFVNDFKLREMDENSLRYQEYKEKGIEGIGFGKEFYETDSRQRNDDQH